MFSAVDAAVSETDEVRMSDTKRMYEKDEIMKCLREAKLEELGFNRTTEFSIETDERGERRQKQTIRYMVRDQCSKTEYWQRKIDERLPQHLFSTNLSSTFSREVQDRTLGRFTKYCDIGLEINVRMLYPKNNKKSLTKRLWPRVRVDIRIRIDKKAKIKY